MFLCQYKQAGFLNVSKKFFKKIPFLTINILSVVKGVSL